MDDYPIDNLLKQIRQVEKQANEIHTKHPAFQDNFSRLMSCLLQAQYHLDILNEECFIDNPNHKIVITNLKDFEK